MLACCTWNLNKEMFISQNFRTNSRIAQLARGQKKNILEDLCWPVAPGI